MAEAMAKSDGRAARRLRGIAIAVVALYLLTGVYAVRPAERVVIRRFGRALEASVGPGLHYSLPWPIDRRARVRVAEPRRVTIGFTAADQSVGITPSPTSARFLAGDENVVQLGMVVQYTVSDPVRFLYRAPNPEAVVQVVAERAMARVLAGMEVDDVLTRAKGPIAAEVTRQTQTLLADLEMGISVSSVTIPSAEPPAEVAADFQDVASAREDYHRIINEADAYAAEVVPTARGKAARLEAEAEGYKLKVVNEASGDAAYFTQLRKQYAGAKEVTASRIYLETMERLLPKMRVIVTDEAGSPLDLTVVRNEP
jgi:membrane protease subunit HflK